MKKKSKINFTKPKVLWNTKCTLGEGTLWVKEHNSIYFVDIKGKKIFSLNIKSKNKKRNYKIRTEEHFSNKKNRNSYRT